MRRATTIAGLLVAAMCWGQYVETILKVPDTMGYLADPSAIVANPVSEHVYVMSDPGALVFDPATFTKVRFIAGDFDTAVVCARAGKLYLVDKYEAELVVVDAAADTVLGRLNLSAIPGPFAYSAGSNKLYVVADHSTGPDSLVVLDVSADTLLGTVLAGDWIRALEWDSLQDRMCVGIDSDSLVKMVDCASDTVVGQVRLTMRPELLVLNPEARKLYCAGTADYVQVVDVDSLRLVQTIPGVLRPSQLAYSPVGNRVYCRRSTNVDLTVIDCSADTVAARFDLPRALDMRASAVSGKAYVLCDGNDSIVVIDAGDTIVGWFPAVPLEHLLSVDPIVLDYLPGRDEVYCAADANWIEVADGSADTILGFMEYARFDIRGLAFNPTVNKLYVLSPTDQRIHVIDSANRVIASMALGMNDADAFPLVVPELNRLYVADEMKLWVIDCSADVVLDSVPLSSIEDAIMVYHPDLSRLYVFPENGLGDEQIWTYDCAGDSLLDSLPVLDEVACAMLHPASGRLYFGTHDRPVIKVLEPGPDTIVGVIDAGNSCMHARMLAGEDALYFANDGNSRLYVVDVRGDSIRNIVSTSWDVDTMFACTTANKLYLCRERLDDNIHVFDCAAESIVRTMSIEYDNVGLMNERNHKLYLSGRDQPNMQILDCRFDSMLMTLPGPGNWIRAMAWNPNQNRVYAASNEIIAVYRDELTGAEKKAEGGRLKDEGRMPTVLRGMLRAGHDWFPLGETGSGPKPVLLDITGRRILELVPGENDIRHLAPGVYFVHQPSLVRKVIIER